MFRHLRAILRERLCPREYAERQEIRGLNLPGPPRAPGGLLREYLYLYCGSWILGEFVYPCAVDRYKFQDHKKVEF
jgi:hypothetical protein